MFYFLMVCDQLKKTRLIVLRLLRLERQVAWQVLRLDRKILRVDRPTVWVHRRMNRRVLLVHRRVLRADEWVLRKDKWVLRMGEEYYEQPEKQYRNAMNTTLTIDLFILTLLCVKLLKKLISFLAISCISLTYE